MSLDRVNITLHGYRSRFMTEPFDPQYLVKMTTKLDMLALVRERANAGIICRIGSMFWKYLQADNAWMI